MWSLFEYIMSLLCFRWRYWLDKTRENKALSVRFSRNVTGLLLKV